MTLTDRLHAIEAAAQRGEVAVKSELAKVGSAIAEHLPAIANDPIVQLVESLGLTAAERAMVTTVINEVVKVARSAASLAPAPGPAPVAPSKPTAPTSPSQDSGPVADDPAPGDVPAGSVPVDPSSASIAAVSGDGVPSAG